MSTLHALLPETHHVGHILGVPRSLALGESSSEFDLYMGQSSVHLTGAQLLQVAFEMVRVASYSTGDEVLHPAFRELRKFIDEVLPGEVVGVNPPTSQTRQIDPIYTVDPTFRGIPCAQNIIEPDGTRALVDVDPLLGSSGCALLKTLVPLDSATEDTMRDRNLRELLATTLGRAHVMRVAASAIRHRIEPQVHLRYQHLDGECKDEWDTPQFKTALFANCCLVPGISIIQQEVDLQIRVLMDELHAFLDPQVGFVRLEMEKMVKEHLQFREIETPAGHCVEWMSPSFEWVPFHEPAIRREVR